MTLFLLIVNTLAVPIGIAAHLSPWAVASNAIVAGALFVLAVLEKRGLV